MGGKESSEKWRMSKVVKIIYTIILCYLLFCFGLQISLIGPALVDLTYIYNVSTETAALITSLTAIGSIIGALSAAMFRWINRQFALSVSLITGSIAFGFLPHASSFTVVYVIALLLGYSQGILDTSQNVWLLELWHENPNSVMQLSQALFGVGTIVAPLITGPYLTGNIETNSTNTTTNTTMPDYLKEDIGTNSTNTTYECKVIVTPEERRDKLMIPFLILSTLMTVGALANLLMFFISRYVPPPKEMLEKSRDTDTEEKKLFERSGKSKKIIVIGLASLCLGSLVSVEVSFFNFSPTFAQYIPLKVSAPDAATMLSVFSMAFTVARCLNFFVAMKLTPSQLLIIHYSVTVLSQILLLFAKNSLVVLWIANVTMGYGFSAMWSSIITFTEKYIVLNDTVGGVMLACAGVFSAISPYLIGLIIESDPMGLVYVGMAITGFSILMYVLIKLMVYAQKSNFSYAKVRLVFQAKKNQEVVSVQ